MAKHGKNYRRPRPRRSTATTLYSPLQAAGLAKETSTTKYDATVEVAMRLGVDPRKADQMVRGTVNLPHGTGKTARVIVFATGDKAAEAEAAGADVVGSDDLIERIQGGFLDFDAAIATPDQMAKVGRIARILGPRGLMPNPKTGTVTPDVTKAVNDIKGGKINFRVDKQANLHLVIGKTSFDETKLVENYAAALDEVLRAKPSAAKGRYLKKVTVSTTMGPGIPVDPNRTRNLHGGRAHRLRHRTCADGPRTRTSRLRGRLAVPAVGWRLASRTLAAVPPKTAGRRTSACDRRSRSPGRPAQVDGSIDARASSCRPSFAPCALRRGVPRLRALDRSAAHVAGGRPTDERRPMPTQAKNAAIDEITERFQDSSAAVLTEYRGLTVAQLTQLRRSLGAGSSYAVVKNTLTKRAADSVGYSDLGPAAHRSDRDRLHRGRPGRGRQGHPRLRARQPAARHQGRRGRRPHGRRRRGHPPRRRRVP